MKFNEGIELTMNKFIIASVLTTSLIFGYLGYSTVHQKTSEDLDIETVHASWGDEYTEVESLFKDSDLVVVATLSKELNSYQPFEGHEDTFTDGEIRIIESIKNEGNKDAVIVSQYGGKRVDGKIEVFEDLPLLRKDKKYLLFLEKIEDNTDRNDKYQTVRGVQGFYTLSESFTYLESNEQLKGTVNGFINRAVIEKGIHGLREMSGKYN